MLVVGRAAGASPAAGGRPWPRGQATPTCRTTDLAQFVVEAGLGLEHGFWNLVTNGASFRSLGRRPTRPGRQLLPAYRAELNRAEGTVNDQVQAWRDGRPTPVGPELTAMQARWRALRPGEKLAVEWPARRFPQA